jgi:hypothetical protein
MEKMYADRRALPLTETERLGGTSAGPACCLRRELVESVPVFGLQQASSLLPDRENCGRIKQPSSTWYPKDILPSADGI